MTETVAAGDRAVSRKKHPCGGETWTVLQAGSDVRVRCDTCGRTVQMSRDSFLRRMSRLPRPEGSGGALANPSGDMV